MDIQPGFDYSDSGYVGFPDGRDPNARDSRWFDMRTEAERQQEQHPPTWPGYIDDRRLTRGE